LEILNGESLLELKNLERNLLEEFIRIY